MLDIARKSISKYFITKGRIDRKINTKSDIGGLSASWTTHQENVPMSIQILTLEELEKLQGELHNYTHRCFLPIKLPSRCFPYEGVNLADVRIRPYKGKDEIFLAEINPINLEQKFVEVLKNVISGIDPEVLTLGDRLYIILWEYINSYSEITQIKTMCSHCLKSIEVGVDL